jgi:lactoylglutathione lyase
MESVSAITLFVSDTQRSKEFYARAFEAEVVWEDANSVVFRLGSLVLNLLQRGPAVSELLGPVPAAEPGASFLLTVPVDDCDAASAAVAARGVELASGPIDRPWGIRTASFLDPDGYAWELAADLPA